MTDTGNPARIGTNTATGTIRVQRNKITPSFTTQNYQRTYNEDTGVGTTVETVIANDADTVRNIIIKFVFL